MQKEAEPKRNTIYVVMAAIQAKTYLILYMKIHQRLHFQDIWIKYKQQMKILANCCKYYFQLILYGKHMGWFWYKTILEFYRSEHELFPKFSNSEVKKTTIKLNIPNHLTTFYHCHSCQRKIFPGGKKLFLTRSLNYQLEFKKQNKNPQKHLILNSL